MISTSFLGKLLVKELCTSASIFGHMTPVIGLRKIIISRISVSSLNILNLSQCRNLQSISTVYSKKINNSLVSNEQILNCELFLEPSFLKFNNKNYSKYSKMAPTPGSDPSQLVESYINKNKIMLFSKSFCPFCNKVKEIFRFERIGFESLELDLIVAFLMGNACLGGTVIEPKEDGVAIQDVLAEKTGLSTVPNVFINGTHVGGSDKIADIHQNGDLMTFLNPKTHPYDYDYVVIGGGSGGLASAKEAARYGAKSAVCDFVTSTPKGTTWGLGGTCVNVGCIPKKLMHQAAIHGHGLQDAKPYGWNVEEKQTHDWGTMVEGIQNHIGSLNWGYKVALRDKQVDYLNAFASFVDSHTIMTVDRKGREKSITADKFMIAVGGRPRYPDIPGAREFGVTSDDLFSLPYAPGKTLLIGASYISLECAGFLVGLGYDVTVMVRSILLRGFDQQMANKIGSIMEGQGVKFIRETIPTSIEQVEEGSPGLLRVKASNSNGEEVVDEYNTVIFAVGRDPCTASLSLEKAQVATAKSGKIIVDKYETTSQSNIFAVGDVIEGGLELTPVAIQAGKLLARRLYGNGKTLTDYKNVPTTVFTPIEYGCCGYSEEDAIENFGANNINVYHSNFWPLEYTVSHRPENDCYAKLIVHKRDGDEYVIGFHYLGPNAGEVTQGFSLGLKMGATKSDFDDLIGIHPTTAEIFTTLTITKSSGKDVESQGC